MNKDHFFLAVSFLIVFVDQLSKFLVRRFSSSLGQFPLLVFVRNYGAGFGILHGQRVFLIIFSFIVIGLILHYYDEIPELWHMRMFAAFLLGGTVGNLFDRLLFGYVTDFIDLGFWPTFNIADAAVTVGVIGLLLGSWEELWLFKKKVLKKVSVFFQR